MTTYVAIPNGDIDQDSPVTQPLLTALRDNLVAIAEQDSSVPVGLRLGHWLLGTLTTTSGTTQTLSSLTLTSFKHLRFLFDGVGYSGATGATITLVGVTVVASTLSSGRYRGIVEIDLATGAGYSVLGSVTTAAPSGTGASDILALRTSVTTATTSVSVTSTSPSFVAGTIRVYGVK